MRPALPAIARLAAILAALLVLVQVLDWTRATTKLDRLLHDAWVRLGERAPPADVVIAAIDEASLRELGRWPWSRDLQSVVIAELGRLGARALLVDIVYAEPSDERGSDRRLAAAIGALPVAVLPVLMEDVRGAAPADRLPVPVVARAATALGHVALPLDDDGIARRAWLKAGIGTAHWSILGLAAHEALGQSGQSGPDALPGRRVDSPARPPGAVPAPGARRERVVDHEVMLPFYGPAGTFTRVSVADIVAGRTPRDAIAGRVVLLGLTAGGLGDSVPSPVSALDRSMPGIEAHATLYAALADGSLIVAAPRWTAPVVGALVLPVLLAAYSRARPGAGLAIALAVAAVPVALSAALYAGLELWYAPMSASLSVLAAHVLWSRHRLAFVNRFLEQEGRDLERHMPRRGGDAGERLATFFDSASRHLAIDGWRFVAAGRVHGGGEPVPMPPADRGTRGWRRRGDVHARRYPSPARLEIAMRITDPALAVQVVRYVDSLGRVRGGFRPHGSGGAVERLQANALRLSGQLARLGGIKTFSETLMSGAPIGVAIWTPAGELVRANPLARALVSGLPERPQLVDFLAALGQEPATAPGARGRLDGLLLRGEPWQIVHADDDREIVADLTSVGATLASRLVCASIVDVSDLRRVERARAELVDYLSHDLRSPLISALYLVEGIGAGRPAIASPDAPHACEPFAARPTSPPEGIERRRPDDEVRRIAANIRRSLGMMDDLLHVARADALDESRFDEVLLDAVVDNALDQLLPQARGRRVRLVRVDAAAGIDGGEATELWVLGDAGSLERAVGNIVGNAIKYSHEDGEVRVSLVREPAGTGASDGGARGDAAGVAADGGDRALLRVEDDGVGIDPAVIDTLFLRFRRDARVARSHEGIGLGLALVARVVSQHGGTVEARSEGRGTEIRLRLPLVDP